jgi:hypothetical protein
MLVLNANTLFYWELSCRTNAKPSGLIQDWSRTVENAARQAQSQSSTQPSNGITLVEVPLVSKGYKWKGRKPKAPPNLSDYMDASDEAWLTIEEKSGSKAEPPKQQSLASSS